MSEIRELHRDAMDAAGQAFVARRRGDQAEALDLFRHAFELELRAADLVADDIDNEPTRSVLHRSAATLALDCNDLRAAERIAARGLAGDPPEEIAQELREVLEQTQFDRHLQVRGVTLDSSDIQLTLAGNAIAPGMALADVFIDRVRDIERLVRRTYDRILGKSFQENTRSPIELFISVPRTGSFAVSLKIGRPDQSILPGFEEIMLEMPNKIVDEVLTCFDLLNGYQEDVLKDRLSEVDPAYYQNFMALSQKIAPDGELINFVGLTTTQNNNERKLIFRRPKDSISAMTKERATREFGRRVEYTGLLRFADEIGQKNKIKIVAENGETYTITVPPGMMNDIVKPYWGEAVKVTGISYRNSTVLETIDSAPK